jgi:hypothetical protein
MKMTKTVVGFAQYFDYSSTTSFHPSKYVVYVYTGASAVSDAPQDYRSLLNAGRNVLIALATTGSAIRVVAQSRIKQPTAW